MPAVNQIEVHPYFRQSALLDRNNELGIVSQAWSPIGGITFYRDSGHTSTLENETIRSIADAHGKTPAQVMLGWHLQQGRQVKLSGFGNFDLRDKRQRPGRNPKTGEEIPITARRVVTFRPGQKLKARVEAYAGTKS